MTEDAGCDVAPQKWGHDSTDSLVERVRRGLLGAMSEQWDAEKALTELAERLKRYERGLEMIRDREHNVETWMANRILLGMEPTP